MISKADKEVAFVVTVQVDALQTGAPCHWQSAFHGERRHPTLAAVDELARQVSLLPAVDEVRLILGAWQAKRYQPRQITRLVEIARRRGLPDLAALLARSSEQEQRQFVEFLGQSPPAGL